MKILFTCLSNGWGGLEMYTLTILLQLKKNNFDVSLLAIKNSQISIEAKNENIITHEINSVRGLIPFTIYQISLLLKKENYDVIHSHSSKDLWLIVPAMKLIQSKSSLHFTKHVASGIEKKDFLHNWLYKRINRVYAISKMIKNNLIDTTSIPSEKIFLLYNGIDTQKFNPDKINRKTIRNEFNIADNEILIGMIGRISQGKGHEEFIKSAEILLNKYTNLKFMIVGHASIGEEEYYKKIKSLATSLVFNEKIIFTGLRKDTPEIFSALDIFVFPSHDESFGLTLVEGMSMQVPNVCTRASGVLEIAIDNETSLLFEKGNAEDLADKVSKLIDSPSLRITLGLNSRKRVMQLFDLENYTQQLINHYKETIVK